MIERKNSTYIAHIDCNAFFASVEQALNPLLKNKAVMILGSGKSIVVTASYEARALGIKTGTPYFEAKKLSPNGIFLKGDFKNYQNFSSKLAGILMSFGCELESGGIDEYFIDIKGLKRLHGCSYFKICERIKEKVKNDLGITVSIGLSSSKTLAKLGSDFKKPDAITIIEKKDIKKILAVSKLSDIVGIGENTNALLNKFSIFTPIDFISSPIQKIKRLMGKNGEFLYYELQGISLSHVTSKAKIPKSISRSESFAKTNQRNIIYDNLCKNIENAFWELRRKQLKSKTIEIFLREVDYKIKTVKIPLNDYTNCQIQTMQLINKAFNEIFNSKKIYRSSGINIIETKPENAIGKSLFDEEFKNNNISNLFDKIDLINEKYGRQTITFASCKNNKSIKLKAKNLITPYLGECD